MPIQTGYSSTGGALPDLNRDRFDGQRDRRLRLGRFDPNLTRVKFIEQLVGDLGAERLKCAVGAPLGDERDELADAAVVNGVLNPVCDGCVAGADVEAKVEDKPLADLLLGEAVALKPQRP